MNKYMHLMDGQPAYYEQGKQIVFAAQGTKLDDLLVESLNEIKRQRYLSASWRRKQGFNHDHTRFSYLRVKL